MTLSSKRENSMLVWIIEGKKKKRLFFHVFSIKFEKHQPGTKAEIIKNADMMRF